MSSPPYSQQQTGRGLAKSDAVHFDGHKFGRNHGYQNQGQAVGQLAAMAAAVVISPPYEASLILDRARPGRALCPRPRPSAEQTSARRRQRQIDKEGGEKDGEA